MPVKPDRIEGILRTAIADAMRRAAPALQRQLAVMAAEEFEKSLAVDGERRPIARRPRARGEELTRWVADNRARRVPKFVIEATGLDTKKKIIARFGPDVEFEKSKPLPKARSAP